MRIALATCDRLPNLDEDEALAIPALAAIGIEAVPAIWSDEWIDWASFDAVIIRATWDYTWQLATFIEWTRTVSRVTRLLNPAETVEWNSDKHYLRDLHAGGIRIVPTEFIEVNGSRDWSPPEGCDEFVVKPTVSAGARDTERFNLRQLQLADAHLHRILDSGRAAMVQPYLSAVERDGETALIYVNGEFSHAIRKGALLTGAEDPAPEQDPMGLYTKERIAPREPRLEEVDFARQVLRCVPDADELLYARIDVIPDHDARPTLIELELVEPSLFLATSSGAAERLAEAIASRLARRG